MRRGKQDDHPKDCYQPVDAEHKAFEPPRKHDNGAIHEANRITAKQSQIS
jgi:hypothetical protein